MIIERYLLREAGYTFLGVGLLLTLIQMSTVFVRILADTAEGKYPVGIVMELFFYRGVGNLVFILPLSFFLGILLALGRPYKDSEMTALVACGVGPKRVYRAIGGLSVVVAMLMGALALWFAPWAEEQVHLVIDEAQASSQIEGLEAGRFNKSESGEYLVYMEEIGDQGRRLENVFGYAKVQEQQRPNLLTSESGYQTVRGPEGDRYLVFVDGYRYEGDPADEDFQIIEFGEHGVLIRERPVVASERRRRAVPSGELWESENPSDMAELQWRISVPISAVLFGFLAVPLARTSPRQGRYGKLFFAIVIYIAYNNLLTVARASLREGEYGPEVGLWWVHLLVVALVLALVWWQGRMPGPKGQLRVAK